jgi:hypothetical protein
MNRIITKALASQSEQLFGNHVVLYFRRTSRNKLASSVQELAHPESNGQWCAWIVDLKRSMWWSTAKCLPTRSKRRHAVLSYVGMVTLLGKSLTRDDFGVPLPL